MPRYVAPIANIHAIAVASAAHPVTFLGETSNADESDFRNGLNHSHGITMTRQQITESHWPTTMHHCRSHSLLAMVFGRGNARLTGLRPFSVTTWRMGARSSDHFVSSASKTQGGSVGIWPES